MAHLARRQHINFNHPDLGSMKGLFFPASDPAWSFFGSKESHELCLPLSKKSQGVAQFRGIPYASIPMRFRQSRILETIPQNFDTRPHRDFTEFGYGCPQIDQAKEPKGGPLGPESHRKYDEWACLNLNVTCPVEALSQNDGIHGLPVMVYVHGGGFSEGAGHISLSHDLSRMVALAAAEGMPIIGVAIGYRVNWHGFLACQDLVDEAEENGEDEAKFNYGLHDQRIAFQWIQRFIAGFGGDGDNITAFGESAGAASLSLHATASVPLFRRAVFESGTPHLMPPPGKEFYECQYKKLLHYLKVEGNSAKERLRCLRAVPQDRLIDAVRDLEQPFFYPYREPEANFWNGSMKILVETEGDLINQNQWLEEIIIGDCTFEGYLLVGMMRNPDQKKLVKHFMAVLGRARAEELLKYYRVEVNRSMDKNLFWTNSMVLLGDIFFSQPINELAERLLGSETKDRSIYRYTLGLSNPFPGSAFSYVPGHHFVDLLYIFMTFRERLPHYRNYFFARQGEELARKWIQFANAREPWPKYDQSGTLLVCNDRSGCTIRNRSEDEYDSKEDVWGERRYHGWQILSKAFQEAFEKIDAGVHSYAKTVQDLRNHLLNFAVYEANER